MVKRAYIVIILLIAASSTVFMYNHSPPVQDQPKPPDPYVSIGCDCVLWNDDKIELLATTRDIDKPEFEWIIDGMVVENADNLALGEHKVTLNVNFGDQTLQAQKTIIIIDSTDDISINDFQYSKNQWRFQTLYQEKQFGIKNVLISVDSSTPTEVNSCGYLITSPIFAGKHTWQAEYQGKVIASGSFDLKETSDIKISSIEIAPRYKAGDTVNGKIVLTNMASTTITGFEIETLVVNQKYEWMGDQAKKEYHDKYTSQLKPGGKYSIPIRVTIPEKVSGIRPTGTYSITINLILNGQIIDTKVVNTEVV